MKRSFLARSAILATAGLFLLACGERGDGAPGSGGGAPGVKPSAGGGSASPSGGSTTAFGSIGAAAAPSIRPELPDVRSVDRDGNRVDDLLDARYAELLDDVARAPDAETRALAAQRLDELVPVQLAFSGPPSAAAQRTFVSEGGQIAYVFRAISYGFRGTLPRSAVERVAGLLGPDLLLIGAERPMELYLDRATRTGRVRPIWAAGFAANAQGFSGSATTTIAVMDSGVDGSHTDLVGRMAYWKDYTADAHPSAVDYGGHGTHVSGIAFGTGAAFGIGNTKLSYTDGGDLTGAPSGSYYPNPIHLPGQALTFSSSAKWLGGGSQVLGVADAPDGNVMWNPLNGANGASPLLFTYNGTPAAGTRWTAVLLQGMSGSITSYAVANTISFYPAVGDGFNALRGVASGCKWAGARVFDDAGNSTSGSVTMALDDLVVQRVAKNIKVLNMSFGETPAGTQDPMFRAQVITTVQNGITVVVAAGNDGPSGGMSDPARSSLAITVAAANDVDQLTDYSTAGFAGPGGTEDTKPDVIAPGGSSYYANILSADSNNSDAESASFADMAPNDYANFEGTSMATPFVAGSAALVIQALEASGATWSFASSASPLLVKMLLAATATETNTAREGNANNPSLGRAATPKDVAEGFGIINPDAAVEAVTLAYAGGTLSDTSPGGVTDRRAWGRKLALVSGATWNLSLTMAATADYDLYLYAAAPTAKGDPVVLASSTSATVGAAETIAYTPAATGTGYLVIKRVSGSGIWTLTGGPVVVCAMNGAACDDGNACTKGDTCQNGSCVGGAAVVCAAPDQCHAAGTCNVGTGLCSNPAKADGTACNDGTACTAIDVCQAGTCVGANPVVCATPDACHTAGTCNAMTGVCSNPAKADGTTCSDGNACTQGDTCKAGTCVPGAAITCAAPDQCHTAGVCNTATGVCSNPAKSDGTACNDGSACTATDVCQAGTCVGASPVVCVALDTCHLAGTCNPATGACPNPVKADGSACSDGNGCTTGDACKAGACTPGTPVVCAAQDACHTAGTCSAMTGACSNPTVADGTPCNDQSACTTGDTCKAGTCAGTSVVTCAAQDQCHAAGTCNAATGTCSNPTKTDGVACDDGNGCTTGDACKAGACVGGAAVSCAAQDACHTAGVCNGSTGMCSNPSKADGTPCDDGDACTQGDVCKAGTCVGGVTPTCTAKDACHVAGTCDPATGACTNPNKADGSACSDGNACTQTDACQGGVCTGANPVTCATLDQCHVAGTCNAATGVCSNPTAPDGTGCNDGNACTAGDACQAGACVAGPQMACPPATLCQVATGCDQMTGACTYATEADGTPCPGGHCAMGMCAADGSSSSSTSSSGATGSSSSTTSSGATSTSSSSGSGGATSSSGSGASSSGGAGGATSSSGAGGAGGASVHAGSEIEEFPIYGRSCTCEAAGAPAGGVAPWGAALSLLAMAFARRRAD